MKLPGFLSRFRSKAAVPPLSVSDGWPLIIREPWAGAFQQHVVVDAPRDITRFSAVYACVTGISNDIAKLRPMLVENNRNGTCTEVDGESPYRTVLENPNHYQNPIQFIQQWMISKLLWGNTYALKQRDNRGMVRKLFILDPQRVKVLVADSGDVYYELSADNLAGLGQNVTVLASEVIHDRNNPLWHPLVGVSPLYAGAVSATMGNRIQGNSTNFFQNMSQAGGYLTTTARLSDQDAGELARRWRENYSGANAGKIAVLANGLTFNPAQPMPAQEAQLIEQLKWTIEDIARCFHMPAYKIGGAIPANQTVEALNQTYYSECLQILMEAFERCIKDGLSMPARYEVKLDLDGLLRMDRGAQIKAEAEGIGAGIFKPDESRRRLNLPPVPGGDACYLQQQNYSLEALAKRDSKPDPFGTAKPQPAPQPANDERMDGAEARSIFRLRTKGAK